MIILRSQNFSFVVWQHQWQGPKCYDVRPDILTYAPEKNRCVHHDRISGYHMSASNCARWLKTSCNDSLLNLTFHRRDFLYQRYLTLTAYVVIQGEPSSDKCTLVFMFKLDKMEGGVRTSHVVLYRVIGIKPIVNFIYVGDLGWSK